MRFIIALTVNLLFSQNVANKNQLIADNHGLFESNLNENWFKEKRKKSKRDNRQRKRETRIIWYLTDELELSADQAEKFFPQFRAHREEIQKIRIQITMGKLEFTCIAPSCIVASSFFNARI